ncbi:hypothetical protein PSTG_14893 [Puccinia striiformis f. sp. tritici PST-78]|uniref:F-box domain-containing protein n=1 Tax=Puccinia striiformis f. sp. tritici PST-78 TaxID=1165861 RepID=A0A0L0UXA2_9BASI|nr:hypothetical protein PSTG_14893 [Puccinia striiformis f. sp. tritici PST-78]
MANISNLPDEVLGLIFQDIFPKNCSGYHDRSIGKFRLVCRRWSNFLTDHYLYQTLSIRSSTQALQFILHQIPSLRLQFSNVRPKCKVLNVWELWTYEAPVKNHMVTPPLLEGLIEIFHDTIVELGLGFINHLSLPTSTIQAIGRIKNLRTLRLDYEQQDEEIGYHHATDFFCSLLSAAQGLKCLTIGMFDPPNLPKILVSDLGRFQLPHITHLVAGDNSPPDLLLSLAIALKPTLTIVSYFRIFTCNDEQDVPCMFKILEKQLQGLYIVHLSILETISHVKFSSLRLLHIDLFVYYRLDELKLDMFSCAPIEILVLSSHLQYLLKDSDQAFLLYLFKIFRSLRRLVLCQTHSNLPFPENCLKACQDHQIECLYRNDSRFVKYETHQGEVDLAKEAGTARNISSPLSSGRPLFKREDTEPTVSQH